MQSPTLVLVDDCLICNFRSVLLNEIESACILHAVFNMYDRFIWGLKVCLFLVVTVWHDFVGAVLLCMCDFMGPVPH